MSGTIPVTFTVNLPRDAVVDAAKKNVKAVDQGLRDRAISQSVATFVVAQSFALIHVAVGASRVDEVEKAEPIWANRTSYQHDAHHEGLVELIPGILGSILAFIVMVPSIRAAMSPFSTKVMHIRALKISFVINLIWCAWFAAICGVFSYRKSPERGRVDALNLILAIINFVFMLVNVFSSRAAVQRSKEAEEEWEAKKGQNS